MTAGRCLVPRSQRRYAGQEVECAYANAFAQTTHALHGDSCATFCSSPLHEMHCKEILCTSIYEHMRSRLPCPRSKNVCVAIVRVIGSPSPQMTNRFNQLPRDPSCCCNSHYSCINTYIKQSGPTGHYNRLTHTLLLHIQHTRAHTRRRSLIIAHAVNSHCHRIITYHIKGIVSFTPRGRQMRKIT